MIIDIRENLDKPEGIKFDSSNDILVSNGDEICIKDSVGTEVELCSAYGDGIDNLIKALQKAKELWGE